MGDKAKRILFGVGSFLVAAGFVLLIYFQQSVLKKNRVEVDRLKGDIEVGRALVMETPDLEREVIVQRETDEVIKEILSDDEEITNFVRTINDYELASDISITQIKKQKSDARAKARSNEDFDRVGYAITFDADAFQLLAFLNALETHKRFISVTAFKVTAAKRTQLERGGIRATERRNSSSAGAWVWVDAFDRIERWSPHRAAEAAEAAAKVVTVPTAPRCSWRTPSRPSATPPVGAPTARPATAVASRRRRWTPASGRPCSLPAPT